MSAPVSLTSVQIGNRVAPPAYTPPSKFVVIEGVTRLNPAYIAYQKQNNLIATTTLHPDTALPVASSLGEQQAMSTVSERSGCGVKTPSDAATAALEIIQDAEVLERIGLSRDGILESLNSLFTRHEVPFGLLNKLLALQGFDGLEFIVDDSTSMGSISDPNTNSPQTRWSEAKNRLKEMVEVLAYLPIPPLVIGFLNRSVRIELEHTHGEDPRRFIERAYKQIEAVFLAPPRGSTPIQKVLADTFSSQQKKRVARYLFCDGEPDGGELGIKGIEALVKNRRNPEDNPITFLSCTDQTSHVQWMKELEEIAPHAAEYDDFKTEAEEVHGDQGTALPFTYGFYLIAQLVGAMNPDDIDAMDESIPFTKQTLENLLGVTMHEPEYRYYFTHFETAQSNRKPETPLDLVKKNYNWTIHYHEFLNAKGPAKHIAAVHQFKQTLKDAAEGKLKSSSTLSRGASLRNFIFGRRA